MRIGQKLRQAITSSFIEVRLDEEHTVPTVIVAPPPAQEAVYTPEPPVIPEPLPEPEPDPLTPPDLSAALKEDGSLNDNTIYGGVSLSAVPFNAEQAVEILVGMPYGVTARGRCETMKQAISVVTTDPCSAGHLVVSDAAQKMVALNQYLTRNRGDLKAFRRNVAEEMERLHERLNGLRVMVDETNASYQALEEAGRVRVDNLTGVIAFFDEFQAFLRLEEDSASGQSSGELPAYLRDDTAMKLLGVAQEKEAA